MAPPALQADDQFKSSTTNDDGVAADTVEKSEEGEEGPAAKKQKISNGKTTADSKTSISSSLSSEESKYAIESFQKFLTFETVSSLAEESFAYVECSKFLIKELQSIPSLSNIHILEESPSHSPVVVAVWEGTEANLPILLLNSHYDVVPAIRDDWTVPPFEGITKNGNIYGRGTQDMKCVCIQYIEAIRFLAKHFPTWKPKRDIYLTFVPDEEVGGAGMAAFLDSKLYKEVITSGKNGIALALDEGLASTTNVFSVFYGERLPWWIDVTATGPTGHGSRFIEHTAVEQLVQLANKALEFRQGQKDKLGMSKHENCTHAVIAKQRNNSGVNNKYTLGDVTSLNITSMEAGVKAGDAIVYNCVPPTAKCTLDIRISPNQEPQEIGDMLDQWCQECSSAGGEENKITWSYAGNNNNAKQHATTSTDAKMNPWYRTFQQSMTNMGYEIQPEIFPAATDSRFLRALGIRALGFSPMRNTSILLHENDEYIPQQVFLEGISVYIGLIQELGSFKEET